MSTHTADAKLDPYTAQAESKDLAPAEKAEQLKSIIKAVPTGMLTTRAADGTMHSRAMRPTQWENFNYIFVFNNASHKAEEIESDSHVNISFFDSSSTDWASISGIAKISNDPIKIKENWSSFMTGYFGKVDAEHQGGPTDPRVSLIEVTPINIRYWKATSGKVVRAATTAIAAVTGSGSPPGELHILSEEEIKLVKGLAIKNA